MTTMADVLEAIVAAARRSAVERERGTSRASLERTLADRRPDGAGFRASLRESGIRVIAECKRRSPSRGILRAAYDPVAIARGYKAAGAAAISVLTEPTFFDGSLDHLRAVRAAVDVPLLRKDFVVTDYQVIEAAAAGADAVLLIVALVEVHDRDELTCALDVGADLVGVNSRNLRTLAVDQSVLDAIGAAIPAGVTAVAESGLKTPDDLRRLHALRYDAFLIGERFMIEPDPGSALATLRAAAAEASV
jgi:indole-3-glycerol phosphate synthase